MKNIAFCITELNDGGAERTLAELAKRRDPQKYRVTVYSLAKKPARGETSVVQKLENANIPVRYLEMAGVCSFFTALFRLRRFLREDKIDILVTFLFHANFLGRLAAWRLTKKVFCCIRVAEREKRWHLWFDRWTQRLVDQYVCVSQSVADFSVKVGKLAKKKIVVIPNGIDISEFSRTSLQNRVIAVGRLDYQKGFDWLLQAAPEFLTQLADWELVIVGEGKDRAKLEAILASEALQSVRDRISLLGWRDDVTELLQSSKIFVLSSRWEGMPNALLQAMSVGLPVVATPVEGVLELLGPAAAEQTCPFGDTETLTRRLFALSREENGELGKKNRERIRTFYTFDTVCKRFSALFDNF